MKYASHIKKYKSNENSYNPLLHESVIFWLMFHDMNTAVVDINTWTDISIVKFYHVILL